MRAIIVPYSSVVGSSVIVEDEDGKGHRAMLAIHHVILRDGEDHKIASEKIAQEVATAINKKAS